MEIVYYTSYVKGSVETAPYLTPGLKDAAFSTITAFLFDTQCPNRQVTDPHIQSTQSLLEPNVPQIPRNVNEGEK